MKRRQLLPALVAAPLAATPSDWSDPYAKTWRDTFIAHWRDTREYTLAVLDAMPADSFDLKPNPAQRTFAEQLTHIGLANVAYFRTFGIGEPPPPSKATTKGEVREYLAACFDYVANSLQRLTEKDLLRTGIQLSPRHAPHSGTDLCLRAYLHTAHHRGQLVVYLRVKGITPPAWKFEPAAV